MTTQTPTGQNATRRSFEHAAQHHAKKSGMDFKIMGNGEYKYLRLEFMWRGWCLAMEHEGETTTAPVDKPAAEPEQEDPLL